MTYQEVAAMVAEIGYPNAYYQFPEGTEQAPPFVCFYFVNNDDFLADNSNYQKIEHLIIELYTDEKDFAKEAVVERVLADHEMVWARDEARIDSERMYKVVYEMDVIITEELNNGE